MGSQERNRTGAHNTSIHVSAWELSPAVCGDVDRKSSLLLKDAQTPQGDRGTDEPHTALVTMDTGWGAFQGCLCWGADLPL